MTASPLRRRGVLLVVSSPAGAGKTTLARALVQGDAEIAFSVSATTRPPRPNETDGQDYHFRDADSFRRMRDAGGFLEWAEVFGHSYGTPRQPVDAALEAGRDMVFDVDWQGAQQIASAAPGDTVRVFILPPSRAEWLDRLTRRAGSTPDLLAQRLAGAAAEFAHAAEYDYLLVNRELDAALATLRAILAAERARATRVAGVATFTAGLLAS